MAMVHVFPNKNLSLFHRISTAIACGFSMFDDTNGKSINISSIFLQYIQLMYTLYIYIMYTYTNILLYVHYIPILPPFCGVAHPMSPLLWHSQVRRASERLQSLPSLEGAIFF